MWISLVAMKVWIRARSAGPTASAALSMSIASARASPVMIGPLHSASDLLDRGDLAVTIDREAGLDHIDAQPSQLLGDLDLLLQVQRDARGLLPVAECRIEDPNPGYTGYITYLSLPIHDIISLRSLPTFSIGMAA